LFYCKNIYLNIFTVKLFMVQFSSPRNSFVYHAIPHQSQPPVKVDISQTEAFKQLLTRKIVLMSKTSGFYPLEISIHQIYAFTCGYFASWLKEPMSLVGSTPGNLFAGGPKPNDIDIELMLLNALQETHYFDVEYRINQWLKDLLLQGRGFHYRMEPSKYGCSIIRMPQMKGWVVNLNTKTQFIFKFFSQQQLHGLSVMDGWKVSLDKGSLSAMAGHRPVTDMNEFHILRQKNKRRDLENGVVQDPRAIGRLYRILHYLGHGAKLCAQDAALGVDEAFQLSELEMRKGYIKHLYNHFPTPAGKLVDYLNFLTLIQDNPKRCQRLSHIVWTERGRFELGCGANLALCVESAPHLTPFLLRFIQGALLLDVLSKNGLSSFKAWQLPFLEGEIRPFFQIEGRYLAMDYPGRQQTPDSLVMEFLSAWEYLEHELPKQGYDFQDFAPMFNILGLEAPALSPTHRAQIMEEFASFSGKPHLRRLNPYFPSDQLVKPWRKDKSSLVNLFKASCQSPRISNEGRLYAQKKRREILDSGFSFQGQEALLQSHQCRVGKKCSSLVISFLSTHGHLMPLLNDCLNQPRLYQYAFEAAPSISTIPLYVAKKLHTALKEMIPHVGTASNAFKIHWVKAAAEQTQDAEIHQKYIHLLSSDEVLKEDPFALLLFLQRQIERSPKEAHKLLGKLQAKKEDILKLASRAKKLFKDTVSGMLVATRAAQVPFIEQLIGLATNCQLFDRREKDEIYGIRARNAKLRGPSQVAAILQAWINFRQPTFHSATIEPLMRAIVYLKDFPEAAQQPFWNLSKDWEFLEPKEQNTISLQMMPFFDFPPGDFGVQFMEYLKTPQLKEDKRTVPSTFEKQGVPEMDEPPAVPLDEAYFRELFNKSFSNCSLREAEDCIALAEKELPEKALPSFKNEITVFLQQQRSFPDLKVTGAQFTQFIRETLEFLPLYEKFCPNKAKLRIAGLLGKFKGISKDFAQDISLLLIKAKSCERVNGSFKPKEWYEVNTTAAGFYVDNNGKKNTHYKNILFHLQEADEAIPHEIASPLQRKAMLDVRLGVALTFLKQGLRDVNGPDEELFLEYINTIFYPYLQREAGNKDGLGRKFAFSLFLCVTGMPAILSALNQMGAECNVARQHRLNFARQMAKNEKALSANLKKHGFNELLRRFRVETEIQLLVHAIDALNYFADEDIDLFKKIEESRIYRKIPLDILNLYPKFSPPKSGIIGMSAASFGYSPIIEMVSESVKAYKLWVSYCLSVIMQMHTQLYTPDEVFSDKFTSNEIGVLDEIDLASTIDHKGDEYSVSFPSDKDTPFLPIDS
jgi:hypothetical protein